MDSDAVSLVCAANIDWLNEQGISVRRIAYKSATLRLVRNELREMFVEVSTEKTQAVKLKLAGIVVHKKFMAEGKASIKFTADKCMLMLSNAPPGTLMMFLKTLFVKMTGEAAGAAAADGGVDRNSSAGQKQMRAKLLSGAPARFEDVSPITQAEVTRAQRMAAPGASRGSITTPSPMAKKRRYEADDDNAGSGPPATKKLFTGADASSSTGVRKPSALTEVPHLQKLNEEQNLVFKTCVGGKSVFFTGSAGTGKSFLLKKIISSLPPDGTVATASTGVAACLIGGVTLHAFAGIGSGDATLKRCYDLASRPAAAQVWRRCKILIIDEVSMVDGEFFDKLESVARYIRRNDRPFGGIQLILCGDFLQLPPVTKSFENNARGFNNAAPTSSAATAKRFCFQSDSWQKVIEISYELKIVHRQKDAEFVRILNLLRIGHVNEEVTRRLLDTAKQKIETGGILATQLCSHTNDAAAINETKLRRLEGETRIFNATDSDASASKQLDGQVPAPARLELKIGAQVMLLKNISVTDGLVNGARGIVLRYDGGVPVVQFKSRREYIAKPEKWMIKTPTGGLLVRRQVPLKLAWAFSIHKSQGLTLDCVEMSLSKVFEAGQAYVALSRVQNLQSLRVLDFDGKQVWANSDVLQFYKMFRRNLHDQTMVPLGVGRKPAAILAGGEKANKAKASGGGAAKLTKSLMSKPLMNIC